MEDFTNYYAQYPEQQYDEAYTPEVYYETPLPPEQPPQPDIQQTQDYVPPSESEIIDASQRNNIAHIRTLMENIPTEEFVKLMADLERDFL